MYEVAAKEFDALDAAPADKPGGAGLALLGGALLGRRWATPRAPLRGGTRSSRATRCPTTPMPPRGGWAARHGRRRHRPTPSRSCPTWIQLARRANFLDHVMLDDEAAMERARLGARGGARRRSGSWPRADLMRRHGAAEPGDFAGAEGPECRCAARCAAVPAAVSAGISRGTPGRGHARRRRCARSLRR